MGSQLHDFAWALIALFRQQNPGNDLGKSIHLMLSVLFFVLSRLSSTLFFSSKEPLEYLFKLLNSNSEQAPEVCDEFELLMNELKAAEVLRCGPELEGVFTASHYHYNLSRVSELYVSQLNEFSVIEFLKKPQPKTPIKYVRHRKNNVELKSKRIIS